MALTKVYNTAKLNANFRRLESDRLAAGLTLAALAAKCDPPCTSSALSLLFNGKRGSMRLLYAVAAALGHPIDRYLLKRKSA